MKEGKIMKCLKIEKGQGFFLNEKNEYDRIDSLKKEDILRLVDIALDSEKEFELDPMDDGLIQNEAHKIIYRNLSQKFDELLQNKNRFIDESEGKYKEALKKYTLE